MFQQAHLVHVLAIGGACAIRAQRNVHARRDVLCERRHAGAEAQVGGWVVHDGGARLCQHANLVAVQPHRVRAAGAGQGKEAGVAQHAHGAILAEVLPRLQRLALRLQQVDVAAEAVLGAQRRAARDQLPAGGVARHRPDGDVDALLRPVKARNRLLPQRRSCIRLRRVVARGAEAQRPARRHAAARAAARVRRRVAVRGVGRAGGVVGVVVTRRVAQHQREPHADAERAVGSHSGFNVLDVPHPQVVQDRRRAAHERLQARVHARQA
jgi:hypothetical protein